MKKNIFDLFINRILNVPLWIKQVLFVELSKDMAKNCCENYLKENLFSIYAPILTFAGKTESSDKKCGYDSNIYNFLNCCEKGYSILEICVNNFFSLEEVAKYFEFCIDQNLIEKDIPKETKAISSYLSGRFKVGEYLNCLQILSQEQLENAISQINSDEKFGETLIRLGYIKENDLKALFILKEEAKKRFVMDYEKIPETKALNTTEKQNLEDEIQLLKEENKKLKQQISKLLEMVRENV